MVDEAAPERDVTHDPIGWLCATLGLAEADAELVWMATLWADHLVAIARHGYPRDNVLPAPLPERLRDAQYVAWVCEALDDELEDDPEALARLRACLDRLPLR